jgi:hypothetical protein
MRDYALVKSATRVLERVFFNSGLYEMAQQPARALTEPIDAADDTENG